MSGDRLARGARSATFGPKAKISQDKWDAAFEDFDSQKYLETEPERDLDAVKANSPIGITR